MGGIVGVLVGVAVIGALIATPVYITSLSTDGARLNSQTDGAVETVRRAILNFDEHLIGVCQISLDPHATDAPTGPVEIPEEQQKTLRQMTQSLQKLKRQDDERGTVIDSLRVQSGRHDPRQLKKVIAEHNKLRMQAGKALAELDAATVGESRGAPSRRRRRSGN